MKSILVASTLFVFLHAALAASTCTSPKEKWLSEAEFKLHLRKQGYLIKALSIRNGCYRVYGLNQYGKRIDISFEPSTGEPVNPQ